MGKMSEMDLDRREGEDQTGSYLRRYYPENYGRNDSGELINEENGYSSDDLYERWKQENGIEDDENDDIEDEQELDI
jgi:hypothetical protein